MKKLFLLFLLLARPVHAATILMYGAELNTTLEYDTTFGSGGTVDSSVKRTGCCSLSLTGTGQYRALPPGIVTGPFYFRGYVRYHVTTNPTGSTTTHTILSIYNGTSDIGLVQISVTTAGVISFRLANGQSGSVVQIGSNSSSVAQDTFHLIELKQLIGTSTSTGTLELKVNGSVVATSAVLNTGYPTTTARVVPIGPVTTNGLSSTVWFDDVLVSNSAYPGAGSIIARQAGSGTPFANGWVASSGSLPTIWQDIPFAMPWMHSNAINGAVQTSPIATFSSTQTNHGTETIGSGDTINAVQGLIVGVVSAVTCQIYRRVNSVDTFTTVTGTIGVDTVYREPFWTDTLTNINAMQLGGKQASAGSAFDIYDIYVLVDSTPSTATPVTLIPLLSRRRR